MKGTKPQLRISKGAVADELAPPDWISAEAAAEWRRVMPGLVERRILTEADLGTLENYCVAQGRVRQLEKILAAAFDAPTNRAQDKAMGTARQHAAELGLTPVSRSRPAIREDEEEDGDASPLDIS